MIFTQSYLRQTLTAAFVTIKATTASHEIPTFLWWGFSVQYELWRGNERKLSLCFFAYSGVYGRC